jgi:hypothetical protein
MALEAADDNTSLLAQLEAIKSVDKELMSWEGKQFVKHF